MKPKYVKPLVAAVALSTFSLTSFANEPIPFLDEVIENAKAESESVKDIRYTVGFQETQGNEVLAKDIVVEYEDIDPSKNLKVTVDALKVIGTEKDPRHVLWVDAIRFFPVGIESEKMDMLRYVNEKGGLETVYESLIDSNSQSLKMILDIGGLAQFDTTYKINSLNGYDLTTVDWTRVEAQDQDYALEIADKVSVDYIEFKIQDKGIVDMAIQEFANKPKKTIDAEGNVVEIQSPPMTRQDVASLVKMQGAMFVPKEGTTPEAQQLAMNFLQESYDFLSTGEPIVIRLDFPNDGRSVIKQFGIHLIKQPAEGETRGDNTELMNLYTQEMVKYVTVK